MAKEFKWEFVVDLKGTHKSFNNSDLERFKVHRYKSLAREVIQNSIDARKDKSLPVLVEFSSTTQKIEDIPDTEGLLKKISSCIPVAAEDKNRAEAEPWFRNAKKILDGKKIEVLRMSDYNTYGMEGPCELGKPFFSFMKAMGDSNKRDPNAAGSHGIGKRAPLVCSKLRTHIMSTRYIDEVTKKEKFLAQGYSLLISHTETSPSGKKFTIDYEGYGGDSEGLMPIENPKQLPEWMRRKEIGTDIFLLGFDKSSHWEKKMTALIITNYFAAFARNSLEVKLQDTVINNLTIKSLFDKAHEYEKDIDDKQDVENLKRSRHFYEVLDESNSEIKVATAELNHLGLVEMRILVKEGLPQEYAVIRANMLIMTDLPGLKRFPNYKDFIAVIECKTEAGENLLRSIEPSRHDSFEIDQLESDVEKKKARIAIAQLTDFIRKSLRQFALESTKDSGQIDFMSQFLSDENSLDGAGGEIEKDLFGKIIITPKKISFNPKKIALLNDGPGDEEIDIVPSENEFPNPGPDIPWKPPYYPNDDTGEKKGEPMENIATAARVIETNSGRHTLNFSIPKSGSFKVSVRAVGLDSDENLQITESNIGKVDAGYVFIEADKSERISLSVLLNRPSLGSYRIVCEELKK